MLTKVIILFVVVGAALGRQSPNADKLDDIFRTTRYSNSIEEDARLDVPDLVRKYGYPIEIYNVETDDGYLLEVHRIPHGRNNADNSQNRQVVFLMHGLLASSADYVLMGPGKGFAYILADAGYDVWMGNARGNYYSRRHATLDPNSGDYWQFSWHEIGHYDLASMIDEVLHLTGKSKLHYVGYSQGTTSFFALASTRPEYNSKILSMQALAPIAFMENLYSPLIQAIAPFSNVLDSLVDLIGMNEFLPNTDFLTSVGGTMCSDTSIFQFVCSNVVFLIAGYNVDQLNTTMLPVIMGHIPAGSSSKQLVHYGQGVKDGHFRQYYFGRIQNLLKYGRLNPPDYDLSQITAPVALHYSNNDWLGDVGDVDRLFRLLPTVIGKFRVPQAEFNHLDFMWAIDAPDLLYKRVMDLIALFD